MSMIHNVFNHSLLFVVGLEREIVMLSLTSSLSEPSARNYG